MATWPIPGRPRKFDDALWEEELRDLVRSDPRQLDFHDALWTRGVIQMQAKGQISGCTVVESKDRSRRLIRSALLRLQCSTDKLKRLFHEPLTVYTIKAVSDAIVPA